MYLRTLTHFLFVKTLLFAIMPPILVHVVGFVCVTTSFDSTTFVSGMDTAGYLNLAADFTHNFTDGIAIGKFPIARI